MRALGRWFRPSGGNRTVTALRYAARALAPVRGWATSRFGAIRIHAARSLLMGMFFYCYRQHVFAAAVVAAFIAANCSIAFARDTTIDVHNMMADSSVRRTVSKNYTVRFTGINPLRYKADLNVVVASTPSPATPTKAPRSGLTTASFSPLDDRSFASFKATLETAARAVDTDLSKAQWPALLDPKNSTGNSANAFKSLTNEFAVFHQELIALAETKPSADSAEGKLLAQATALDSALSPIISTPQTVSSEVSNEGSCFSGGGETDTLTRTPLVPGVTAAVVLKTKADIRCEQALILAPGVVVGALGSPTYEAVTPIGVSPTPTVVAVTEHKSTLQSKTVAELHYRLTDIGESSALHLTALGTLASSDSTGAFEGGLGLSFSTLEDRLFFTIGVLGATKQFARPDAGPGHLIPPNTKIPTEPSTLYPVVFGISFKI